MMMAQSLGKVYIHVVFSTKHRAKWIAKGWMNELHHVIGGIANSLGCQSISVGGMEDHIHHLMQLGRTITIANAIGKMKSVSSLWVNQNQLFDEPFHWQAGYAVFSVSQSNLEVVRTYIQSQEEHHKERSFQDELRLLLKKHEIEWDERYLWD
jgi:putative transposase